MQDAVFQVCLSKSCIHLIYLINFYKLRNNSMFMQLSFSLILEILLLVVCGVLSVDGVHVSSTRRISLLNLVTSKSLSDIFA